MIRLTSCLFVSLVACGGNRLDPGAGDSPGTGTGTLTLEGTVSAEPTINNAKDAANFTTEISVRITRGGADVTSGEVTVHTAAGDVALLYEANPNRWHAVQNGYREVYELDATSGTDEVLGVRVDGPDFHTITAPAQGAVVDSRVALDVTWDRGDTADTASVHTHDVDVDVADSGRYTLPALSLRSKPDQTENDQIEITRSQQIAPAGATAGSSFRVSVRNQIDLVVLAAP